jgi:hypothetical protein
MNDTKKEAKWTKVRGTARAFEKNGVVFLRFPKSIVTLFGLRAGDTVRFRKRGAGYFVTFWRSGQKLMPLKK